MVAGNDRLIKCNENDEEEVIKGEDKVWLILKDYGIG